MAMKLKGFLLILAAFNLYILCYYFVHFPTSNEKFLHKASMGWIQELPRAEHDGHKSSSFDGKPWPELPSYMPWHNPVKAKAGSCEAYFGNGFNRIYRLLDNNPYKGRNLSGGGSFNCFYSETLDTSICEGKRMAMFPERIGMSRGGEDVEAVLGREEEAELPKYSEGAFRIEAPFDHVTGDGRVVSDELLNQIMPQGAVHTHTMRSLLQALHLVPSADFVCDQWIEEPTLLITRFEYANIFHTYTDWYNSYVTSRVAALPKRPRVVFVDGHCKSPMDDAWEALFTSVAYAKHFSGPVCFRHVLLTPLGYETALFKGLTESIPCYGCSVSELKQKPEDRKTARLVEYGEMFRAAFGLLSGENKNFRSTSVHNVLFMRREHYLAHPRHGGKVESRLRNEEEVLDALQKWASSYSKCKVKIVNGLFAHMAMIDQVRAVQAASVIVGAHGAALTHIISARPGTVVLEIISSFYRRPHFALISQWTGLEYHAINLEGSVAKIPEVVEALSGIMKSLLC
ncbi:beta-1,2-xylosyltransferase RCN11 [Cryptomeria japonica]|uniref:beta-1,2-xylosyltransferase RCN11 n=1 Tax=Cryptomeria japonica TaxID=3369 RepID=UPI0025ABD15D|nr:beta-1,2-xylosyltransferase RCN11 [Cryptomeria japonica]